MKPKFRIIPTSKTYPGLTALSLPNDREIVCMGVGKEVENAIMKAKDAR